MGTERVDTGELDIQYPLVSSSNSTYHSHYPLGDITCSPIVCQLLRVQRRRRLAISSKCVFSISYESRPTGNTLLNYSKLLIWPI